MSNISIKSKLLIMLLSVSAFSIAAVATLSYRESYLAMQEAVFAHLTSVRASKADELERYIDTVSAELEVLAAGSNMGIMLQGFADAVAELETQPLSAVQEAELEDFYRDVFLPKIDQAVEGTPELLSFLPPSSAGRYLQYHYLAKNPYPRGERLQLLDAQDGSSYSAAHRQWHPNLRSITEGLGFFDLFLIDISNGRLVYTTAKEVDLGTSLIDGPHANSNLARLFRTVQRNPDRGAVRIVDYEHYRPSYGEPAMFLAVPVFTQGRAVGVIAVQESTEDLNEVITGGGQWERDGLGKTGETVVIGADFTLRSASRFLIEDPEGFARDEQALGTPEERIQRILRHGSPILEQKVVTPAAQHALHGQTGTGVVRDYRGREILASWAPLKLKDLEWAIAGKIDVDEAYAPIYKLARDTMIQAVIILGLITLIVMLLASSFVRPVNDLIGRVRRFGAGDQEVEFDASGADEIGDLAKSFHELAQSAKKQTSVIEQISSENQRLLENLLPSRIAAQFRQSNRELRETVPDVSVIFVEIRGLAEFTQKHSAAECVKVLETFLAAADEAGETHQAEVIKTLGDTYMAAVGLSTPLLDHVQRAIEFARELRAAVARIGVQFEAELNVVIGISSGPVITNVVYQDNLLFHLWGTAVVNADHAHDVAELGQIVVTADVCDTLAKKYQFRPVSGQENPPLWVLIDE